MPAVFAFGFAAYAAASLSTSHHRSLSGWIVACAGAGLIVYSGQWPVMLFVTLLWHLCAFVVWALRDPHACEVSRGPAAQLAAYLCGLRSAGWFLNSAAILVFVNRFWELSPRFPIFLLLAAIYTGMGLISLLNAFNRKRQQKDFWGDALQPDAPPLRPDQQNVGAAWFGLLLVAFLASWVRPLLPPDVQSPVRFAVELALVGTLALAIALFAQPRTIEPDSAWKTASLYYDDIDPRGRSEDGRYNLANGLGWAYVVVDCARYLLPGFVMIALLWPL